MSAAVDLRAQEQADLVQVRGYALACCEAAVRASAELNASVDALVRCREEAEAALARCRRACDLAEQMSVFAARAMAGDVECSTLAEAAAAIRELVR